MRAHRWVSIATGVIVAGLGGVFVLVGLETADRLASTVGAIAGLAGLGFTLHLSLTQRPTRQSGTSQRPDTPDPQQPGTADPSHESDDGPPARRDTTVRINTVHGAQFGDRNTQDNDFF
ncbi:MAG TPA: hypothetical protein VHJ83_01160 [Micromonosporaceae bacterium]|nr:hypothetical protein [Micromonosporaceae bacterium]